MNTLGKRYSQTVSAIALAGLFVFGSLTAVSTKAAQPEPPPDEIVQTMFYKANSPESGRMWDTWLYMHEGTYTICQRGKAIG